MRITDITPPLTEQELLEINMSPGKLKNQAEKIPALVGMEFEMIVPGVEADSDDDDDDFESEPDYDQDESVRDIQDAVDFFSNGDDWSRHDSDVLRREMQSDYTDWLSESSEQAWEYEEESHVSYWVRNNADIDEVRRILEMPEDAPIDRNAYDLFAERVIAHQRGDNDDDYEQDYYDDAHQDFIDDYFQRDLESEWLESAGLERMTDVENRYSLTWPYYTQPDYNYRSSGDGKEIKTVALEFMGAMGATTVAYSNDYHGTYYKWVDGEWQYYGKEKPKDCFAVEPDGSLEPDDKRSERGLEFVSPPMSMPEMLVTLQKVMTWAKSVKAYTSKTNKTGLHINMSVPGYSDQQMDYIKLAILSGDKQVLKTFDRLTWPGTNYAEEALKQVRSYAKREPEKAAALLAAMKNQLNTIASKAFYAGNASKFSTINTTAGDYTDRNKRKNYVEFRAAGNDWLSKYKEIVNTVYRYVVSLDSATTEEKDKHEYAKKLYKVLAPSETKENKLLQMLSRYIAGDLSTEEKTKFVQQVTAERKGELLPSNPNGNWVVAGKDTTSAFPRLAAVYRFNADDEQQANKVLKLWVKQNAPDAAPSSYVVQQDASGRMGMNTPEEPESGPLYKIFSASGQLLAGDTYGSDEAALERAKHWAQRRGVNVVVKNEQGEEIGRVSAFGEITPTAQTPQGTGTTVTYELYNRDTGEVIDTFQARNDDEALVRLRDFRNYDARSRQNPNLNPGVRRGPGVTNTARQPVSSINLFPEIEPTQQSGVNNLTPRGPGPWELASRSNNQVYFNPEHTNRAAAETEARTWLQQMGLDPAEFEVRTRERIVPQSQATREWTGQWEVRNETTGELLHTFYGIGNNQGDANRVATQWATDTRITAPIEVVPQMRSTTNESKKFVVYVNETAVAAHNTINAAAAKVFELKLQHKAANITVKEQTVSRKQQRTLEEGFADNVKRGLAGAALAGAAMLPQTAQAKHTAHYPAAKPAVAQAANAKKATAPKLSAQQQAKVSAIKQQVNTPSNIETVGISRNTTAEHLVQKEAIKSGLKGTELAQFLAQVAHESADFGRMKEMGGAQYFAKMYDPKYSPSNAKMLGNTRAGDGAKYHGRGFIQITGRSNYEQASRALGIDLVNHPELAATPEVAAKIAVWYWTARVKPHVKNFADTSAVTKYINSHMRGMEDRANKFAAYSNLINSVGHR